MTKKIQFEKNIELSDKLATYLVSKKPFKNKKHKYTFVAFSAKDEILNRKNEKLIIQLIKEGKKVVKALQTSSKNTPWKFVFVN